MNWFGFELSSFLWIFIFLNVINVVIQTIKSIATINCGKNIASITNAVAYGIYTIVVVYMNADGLGLFWKAIIIGLANLFGVWIVKYFEEKSRKDKLWKVEATIRNEFTNELNGLLNKNEIPHSYIIVGKHTIFNCYCATQKDSTVVKEMLKEYNAKYFVTESKVL